MADKQEPVNKGRRTKEFRIRSVGEFSLLAMQLWTFGMFSNLDYIRGKFQVSRWYIAIAHMPEVGTCMFH